MTNVREMLGTVTLEPVFNVEKLATVLQALPDLDRDSTTCASAMMAYHAADMVSAERAALDCADIAAAAHRVLSRATAAERCAAECGHHAAHHGHCRLHSESAQRAAELCRTELKNISG